MRRVCYLRVSGRVRSVADGHVVVLVVGAADPVEGGPVGGEAGTEPTLQLHVRAEQHILHTFARTVHT